MYPSPDTTGLDERLQMLGRLASTLAHEIRNPLGAICLHVDLLEEEIQCETLPNRVLVADTLKEIKTELLRLSELVDNYLSLARVIELHCEPLDLGTVVETFALEMRAQLSQHNIGLRLEGLSTLGLVHLHRNTFRRALLNLIQNAIDAMPHGGKLTLCGRQDGPQTRLEIRDTGQGIPADQLGLLFTPFHTTKSAGTGLGLYVVQQIIAAHKGTITVYSTPGRGTTCVLTLPPATIKKTAGS
jgi:signal transduction histidine kinase